MSEGRGEIPVDVDPESAPERFRTFEDVKGKKEPIDETQPDWRRRVTISAVPPPPPPAPIPPAPPSSIWSMEFWMTAASMLIAVAVGVHWIQPSDVDTLTAQIKSVTEAVFALVAAVVPLIQFIRSRAKTKGDQLDAAARAHEAFHGAT